MNNMKLAGYMQGYMCKEAFVKKWIDDYTNRKADQMITNKMQSPEAYLAAGGVGALAGTGLGAGFGAAYADDEAISKVPSMTWGGLMGGGAGALSGMALLYLLNAYKSRKK